MRSFVCPLSACISSSADAYRPSGFKDIPFRMTFSRFRSWPFSPDGSFSVSSNARSMEDGGSVPVRQKYMVAQSE